MSELMKVLWTLAFVPLFVGALGLLAFAGGMILNRDRPSRYGLYTMFAGLAASLMFGLLAVLVGFWS